MDYSVLAACPKFLWRQKSVEAPLVELMGLLTFELMLRSASITQIEEPLHPSTLALQQPAARRSTFWVTCGMAADFWCRVEACDSHTIAYPYAMPCHAMPCHAMPCHAMPHHTTPYHTIPYHTIKYHTIPFAHLYICSSLCIEVCPSVQNSLRVLSGSKVNPI